MKKYIKGANPYMPLWEHVPDGEPRVFEYNGEKRVYVYGSHDTMRTEYCGCDQVVWSAPVDDLTNWTCHGICYEAADKSILFAPDVVQKGDTFYLYAAENRGSRVVVAKSKSPTGPFTDPVLTDLGFDPGVLVDDDGKVYAYWGFCGSRCAELNEDMATIKEGTLHENPIWHCDSPWAPKDGKIDFEDGFYEASSIRKIGGKYVYIYSKLYNTPLPEYGIDFPCNGFLSYKYSDSPLDGFVKGGDISLNGGEIIDCADGSKKMTYQWGNNHGSIAEVNGRWYIFYHRQTGINEFSRQAMLEPVEVAFDKKGRLFIGNITWKDGEPIASGPVEMTSQGAHVNGMDAYSLISAGYTCHINGSSEKTYVKPVYEKAESVSAPVCGISSGTTVGFRYLQFGTEAAKRIWVEVNAEADLAVTVRMDACDGEVVSRMQMKSGDRTAQDILMKEISGKHAVYFEFTSRSEGVIAAFLRFTFDK